MIVKGILILLAVVVIIGGVLMQSKEKGVALAIVLVLLSFAGDVLSEVTADMIKPLFFGAESTAEEGERRPDSTSAVQAETVLSPAPEPEPAPETPSAPVTEPAGDPESAPAPETSPEPEAPPAPQPPADPYLKRAACFIDGMIAENILVQLRDIARTHLLILLRYRVKRPFQSLDDWHRTTFFSLCPHRADSRHLYERIFCGIIAAKQLLYPDLFGLPAGADDDTT